MAEAMTRPECPEPTGKLLENPRHTAVLALRPATPADIEAVARLVRERVFPTCTVWVGGRGGIAGYCAFRDGWVDHLYVAMARTVGDCVATVVVAVWERELNLQLAARVLDSDVVVEARAA
jgi:hypothetical protein